MYNKIEDFIEKYATQDDMCYYHKAFPENVKKMLKNIYSCCFRYNLYPKQSLFLLNEALKPFEVNKTKHNNETLLDL